MNYLHHPVFSLCPPHFPLKRGVVRREQRKDGTVRFPFFSFQQPSEVRMLLALLCVRAGAVHLATESRSSRQQNSLATCVCTGEREGEREGWLRGCSLPLPAQGLPCTGAASSRDGSNRCCCPASHRKQLESPAECILIQELNQSLQTAAATDSLNKACI